MSSGFIYIMINDSYNGLIKIGRTTISAEERAKQLSSDSGVPTPFRVAYQTYVDDCEGAEKKIHHELHEYRINPNREFFKYPLHRAIDLIQGLNNKSQMKGEEQYEALDILSELRERFEGYIDPKIISARIYQTQDTVYFEQTIYKYDKGFLKDQLITRTDLAFIVKGPDEGLMFKPSNTVKENAQEFFSLDSYSIINCIDGLFTKEATLKVAEEYEYNSSK